MLRAGLCVVDGLEHSQGLAEIGVYVAGYRAPLWVLSSFESE